MNLEDWFAANLPAGWGVKDVEVLADSDEILVVVDLGARAAEAAIERFREVTRDERVGVALAAEAAFGRKVSWGARHGGQIVFFTTSTVPVMTRLRLPERTVLDTLIAAGLARTRSEALAWCVRLVGENEREWLSELRAAFAAVEEVRRKGPRSRRD
ncbi:MAG TPA: hypothetical protein VFN68_12260 [Acidimicrobiales bacterium]|nr:hypothetical protein [Acidimicrobiales bacterium]